MTFSTQSFGVYTIAPTPFLADGTLDLNSVDRLVSFFEEAGCSGITALGMMGEATKLDAAESEATAHRFITRSILPVIVGVSAPGFAGMRSLARSAMDAGAAGVMIAPPNTLRTDDQLTSYFTQAVEAIGDDVPWVLQDFPLGIGVVMSTNVVAKIIADSPSCLMLKHEDWPGLEKLSTLRERQRVGKLRQFSILCGNGGAMLDFEMERGADGAMTGYAFPDALVDIVRLFRAGERDAAHDLFDAHLPLIRYEQQPGAGLAYRKHVLHRRGVLASEALRRPAPPPGAAAIGELDYLLTRLARHDARAGLSR